MCPEAGWDKAIKDPQGQLCNWDGLSLIPGLVRTNLVLSNSSDIQCLSQTESCSGTDRADARHQCHIQVPHPTTAC